MKTISLYTLHVDYNYKTTTNEVVKITRNIGVYINKTEAIVAIKTMVANTNSYLNKNYPVQSDVDYVILKPYGDTGEIYRSTATCSPISSVYIQENKLQSMEEKDMNEFIKAVCGDW
jgi:hypothetical protein